MWRYEYSISDHLGNTRLTFADKTPDGIIKVEDGEVLEEAHYYPFGLAMEGPWMNDAAASLFLRSIGCSISMERIYKNVLSGHI